MNKKPDISNSVIPENKKYLIENVGTYIYDGLSEIVDFDTNWNTLISSTPLLFEDVDYARIVTHNHIDARITEKELRAYRDGVLRECYSTLENLLMCNLEYYDRIISFCTMMFFGYIRLDSEKITRQNMKKLPLVMEMTPTKIWCCALMNAGSTQWEQMYAWEVFLEHQTVAENYSTLLQSDYFSTFIEYRAFINNTIGFRQTLLVDKTPNSNLSIYCSKFTKTSLAISDSKLEGLHEYANRVNVSTMNITNALYGILSKLYTKPDGTLSKYFALYVFPREIYILTGELTIRFEINEKEHIQKEYIANAQQCINLEKLLAETAGAQLGWVRQKPLFTEFPIETEVLKTILSNMLGPVGDGETFRYKQIVCVKIHNQPDCLSKLTFTGCATNLNMRESFIYNGRELKEQRPSEADKDSVIKTLNKVKNKTDLVDYIIKRGYYIFGTESDVNALIIQIENDFAENNGMIRPETLMNYYSRYTVPILNHLKDAIVLNEQYKNNVIDNYIEVTDTGCIAENKLSTEVLPTDIKDKTNTFNARDILNNIVSRQSGNLSKKTYWQIVTD